MTTPLTNEQHRDGAALLAAMLNHDDRGFGALTADLDDQAMHDVLVLALGCAAHCMRDTVAEGRLEHVLHGAARLGPSD